MELANGRAVQVTGDERALFRLGGLSGIGVAVGYPVIIALYLAAGPSLPSGQGGEAWLAYLSGRQAIWWGIVGLSVLTDILWIPIAWALVHALKGVNRVAVTAGAGLLVLFVVLELCTSWPSFGVLIELSSRFAAATTEAERAAISATAASASAMTSSHLLPFYAIFVPALGKGTIGLVMAKGGPFGRPTAALAVLVGALGVVSVLGALVWPPLGQVIIPASLLSGVWFFLVGLRLTRLGGAESSSLVGATPEPSPT